MSTTDKSGTLGITKYDPPKVFLAVGFFPHLIHGSSNGTSIDVAVLAQLNAHDRDVQTDSQSQTVGGVA